MKYIDQFLLTDYVKRANQLSPGLAAGSAMLPLGPLLHGWFGSNNFGQGLREQGRSSLEGVGGGAAGAGAGYGLGALLQKIPGTRLPEMVPLLKPENAQTLNPLVKQFLERLYVHPPKIRGLSLALLLGTLGAGAGAMHGAGAAARNWNERTPGGGLMSRLKSMTA